MAERITDILGAAGRIAKRLTDYELRPQQLEMALAVHDAFDRGQHLIVEAGTGVGKSFAYLVPAIVRAIEHGERVVISTHTIALQEQLIHKDIPFLRTVFEEDFSAELVKGRANYLGLRRLARASTRQNLLFDTRDELAELHHVEDWAYTTEDGSRSDLTFEPSLGVWNGVRSDGDDCLGRKCPHYKRCFFQRARRRAEQAQLLIVNHALLCSDVAMRRQGAAILPDYDFLILDEAHTLESVASDHLGVSVNTNQVRHLLSTMHNERTQRGMLHTAHGESVIGAVNDAHQCLDAYIDRMVTFHDADRSSSGRLREPPDVPDTLSPVLTRLTEELSGVRRNVVDEQDRLELASLMERCKALSLEIEHWHRQQADDWVYWLETEPREGKRQRSRQRVSLHGRPIDVGPALRVLLFDELESAVLTSATLTTGGRTPFSYMAERLSLEDATTAALGSPFDYRSQLTVHVEADMPDPGNPGAFVPEVSRAIEKYAVQTDGRAFVLFTSYRMLQECADAVKACFTEHRLTLLVQGGGLPRTAMLQQFRDGDRCVLFGTDTFWSGVDVPGAALSNVIITKLPFAVPAQPTVEARIEQIRERGGTPFLDFQIPEAILKFKQGVGRLIRTKSDTGIVVILDPRVVTKRYGKLFLDALPEAPVHVHGKDR